MNDMGVIGGTLVLASGGAIAAAYALRKPRTSGVLSYLSDGGPGADVPAAPGAAPVVDEMDPVFERILRPAAQRLTGKIRDLFPSSRLDQIHEQLLHAGLSTKLRAEEFATVQVLTGVVGVLLALAMLFAMGGSVLLRVVGALLLGVAAILGPRAWLSRRVEARTHSIDRDLPDMLDLLTISVEAGLGLEAAMETSCADLSSALAEELARTLQEMSLGLSRHSALENLKTRVSSRDLQTFVLVLTQADSLGMPIGRVLRTQADEMRDRRRARAREAAAKLPVKILFPLMAFILPPLMIVVLGPAAMSIMHMFHHLK